jgi:hypothetical protein
MPKRFGNLMEHIVDPDNLRLAFYKAARGRQTNCDVVEYRRQLDHNLHRLHQQMADNTVTIGQYHYFTVYDPKERVICAASFQERVIHHAIMNVCHFVFDSFLIFDTYATREGKGQYAALERAKRYSRKYKWFCKMDVKKYFDSIDQEILLKKLERRFKDKGLLYLLKRIIKSYSTNEGRGIPIGNLTSQYFANFYLGFADRFLKEEQSVKGYVRYMDDMVIFGNSSAELLQVFHRFSQFIESELNLRLKPICLNAVSQGLPFLGYIVFPGNVRLNKCSKKRFAMKLKQYTHNLNIGIWNQEKFSKHVTPLIGFTQHAASKAMRYALLRKLEAG